MGNTCRFKKVRQYSYVLFKPRLFIQREIHRLYRNIVKHEIETSISLEMHFNPKTSTASVSVMIIIIVVVIITIIIMKAVIKRRVSG